MKTIKPWYASKTIWGSLVAVVAAGASAFGLDIDLAAQAQLSDIALQLVTVGASLFAIFGRLSARTTIE